MTSKTLASLAAASIMTLGGCQNKTESGALIGAGAGGLAGGLIGGWEGAAIGAGVGALGGAVIGNMMDDSDEKQREAAKNDANATTQSENDALKEQLRQEKLKNEELQKQKGQQAPPSQQAAPTAP